MANGNGTSLLARLIDKRIREHGDTPLLIDYGTIKKSGSLATNSFNIAIPADDYMVCASAKVKKGDRVLVVWIQEDPVVIDALKPGTEI